MLVPFIGGGDPDMRKNSTSVYFAGDHFNMVGDIPEIYVKPVLLKPVYSYVYFDSRFDVPLYQLVYNNSVITTHHWAWGDFKIPSQRKQTELKEILYNVPPLYHLNDQYWRKNRKEIVRQVQFFSGIHSRAVLLEMTGFDWLTADHLVQRTRFGDALEVLANFGRQKFIYRGHALLPGALLVYDMENKTYAVYKP
jgi:hypothetical protein